MATIVRGKNLEITPALKDHVEKQEKKVTKYFDNEVNVQALLSVEKDRKIAEITLKVDGDVRLQLFRQGQDKVSYPF